MRGGGEGIDNKTFDNISNLRKEYVAGTKDFSTVRDAYGRIKATGNSATPAGDIAMIYSYMKMLDPGSVVREGEFALIGQSAGVPDRVLMEIARAKTGKGLTPGIRAQLVNTAANILLKRRAAYDAQARNYRTIATDIGAKPDLLAEDPTLWRGRIKGGAGAGGAGAKVQTFNTSAGAVTVRAK